MNYEELLVAKSGGKLNQTQMPIGEFYRAKQDDGKYKSVVDIRRPLVDNITFSGAIKRECEDNTTIADNHQLHFTPTVEYDDVVRLNIVETGQYMSFAEILRDTPAVVARQDFLESVLEGLVSVTRLLHTKGIRHICYSPNTVFARKGDLVPLLISHGSYYLGMSDLQAFYGDDAQYVAPEVLQHGSIDDRCDVYSIGKFLDSLGVVVDLPLEYRQAIKKATSHAPEDRYNTPDEMLSAVRRKHNLIRTAITAGIAVVIALVCVGLYVDMFPESNPVEFVKPAPRQPTDDLLDDGFDPAELGVTNSGDSLIVDESAERDFQAKAEEIFRKKYSEAADRILSKIYNKEYMSNAEKKFTSESEPTINELMKVQAKMGQEAGLSPERAQLIATEIIDRITEKKKKEMGSTNSRAIQK